MNNHHTPDGQAPSEIETWNPIPMEGGLVGLRFDVVRRGSDWAK